MVTRKKHEAPPGEQFGDGIISRNRRAGFDYELGQKFEAGLALLGSEVKVLRQSTCDISEAFVRIERGEAWLHGANIPELSGTHYGHLGKRPRKLLLNRDEITELCRATERDGMTIVATMLYFRRGRAKVEIALARGRKKVDKRHALKQRDADREARAAMADANAKAKSGRSAPRTRT
ncbi:MAG: SsrA-binding protein SmpB [Myxococcales bacterium]|nr:SsrA-binding protein SmpB [Myxococcales bacterium]